MEDRNGRDVRETIEKLAQQIAEADGGSLYDAGREESKAPIRAKALRLLDQRMRSRKELVERLEAVEEFPTSMIEEVVDDLTRSGLVNDELFASEWVRQRFASRGKSKMVLNRELQEKGIDASLRADALEQITHNAEEEVARKLAAKKAATIKTVAPDFNTKQKDLRKVVGVLARRGFPSELSMSIARDQLEERYRELEEDTD
ncbi:RecX family transcriptional regulator [Corynebacterium sp. LK19]|uniref:regulatory protein RecX n=1 Tax=Corynebacterium TaxID=1716 RepID=UPI0008A13C96|nr:MULTISPECIES: regulatory protein RecX [unclassified Corynebacterium]MBC6747446.1 RecX family transcriptional regulator [Corynebacterium sp. LK25]MBC6806347.1 RecX family transcriptional regulator [Corynebacterium sp. LK30]MDU4703597.1 regulatory protein RecX [Corynebacterium sp.]OFL70548.1 RecX family transcriptional regulator [Corynebacterium sp. HMSC063G05]TXS60615.1 RecX family transcriptional regulator [Corynebacterium sp. LK19]